MNVLDLASKHIVFRKVSYTQGGEWQGLRPGCGGEDRFHVWPEQNEGRGGYWCRAAESNALHAYDFRTFDTLC